MLARMLQRRGTAAQWEDVKNTVILAAGEIGLETDTGKFKVGDGVTVWNALSYYLRDSDNDDIYSKLTATQTFTGTQTLSPANASSIPLEVRGVDAQSAKLQRWRVGIGAPVEVASIDAAGKITANGAVLNDDVDMTGNLITNVATPVSGTDAANKQYVDDIAAGISWKAPVNLISASGLDTFVNVALTGSSGSLILDGHAALDSGDSGYRILLIAQTTASENGIYVYTDNGTSYTLARSEDADAYEELDGASVFVSEGTNYGTSSWVQTNHYLTSFSGQDWVQFNGAAQIVADGGLTKVGNTLAVGAGSGIQVNPNSVQIADGGVTSTMIANGTIVDEDISSTADIAPTKIDGTAVTQADTGTVSTTMLADDAVTHDKLADNAVGIENMKDDSVGTAELVNGAVTSAKIFDGTIVNNDISDTAAIAQSKISGLTDALNNKSNITHTHTLDNLSDVTITAPPSDRQVLKYRGSPVNAWINEVPSGGISIGATPPVDASSGDAWFDSTDGSLYVYYDDGVGGLKTNLIPNPSFEINTNGWYENYGSMIRDTSEYYIGTASLKINDEYGRAGTSTEGVFVSPLTDYVFSMWIKGINGKSIRVDLTEYDSSDNFLTSSSGNFTTDGSWQRMFLSKKSESTTAQFRLSIYNPSYTDFHSFNIDAIQFEEGTVATDYFDGSTNNGTWTGTPHASTSTKPSSIGSAQWVQVKANSALEGSILTRLSSVEGRSTRLEGANAVRVLSMEQRDEIFPSPVQGNTVFRADLGYEQKYFEAYDAVNVPDGTEGIPGWYQVTVPGAVSQTNGTVTTANTSLGVVRNIYVSSSAPSGGMDGDVWLVTP